MGAELTNGETAQAATSFRDGRDAWAGTGDAALDTSWATVLPKVHQAIGGAVQDVIFPAAALLYVALDAVDALAPAAAVVELARPLTIYCDICVLIRCYVSPRSRLLLVKLPKQCACAVLACALSAG